MPWFTATATVTFCHEIEADSMAQAQRAMHEIMSVVDDKCEKVSEHLSMIVERITAAPTPTERTSISVMVTR